MKFQFISIVIPFLVFCLFFYFETHALQIQSNGMEKPTFTKLSKDTITLGGGCFWCIEAIFSRIKAVESVESGYAGGFVSNPSYKDVCTINTGHAEVVQIVFNSNKVTLEEILKIFFYSHDPTSVNRQGDDIGDQYRSIVFYRNKYQRKVLDSMITSMNHSGMYSSSIQTKVEPYKAFYKAEDYHQNYYEYNKESPYCKKVIQPKILKIENSFKKNLKN